MGMSTGNLFSKEDLCVLIEVIHSSLSCNTEEQLVANISRLRNLFEYENAVCALVRTEAAMDTRHFINAGFPPEWCRLYVEKGFDKVDPIMHESARNSQGIQYWTDTYKKYNAKSFRYAAEDFGLKEGYSHGAMTVKGDRRSLFSFAGPRVRRHPRINIILEYAIPHLDQAFNRIVERANRESRRLTVELSSREKEVLTWAKDGKSTWEISKILSISSNTVKFHLKNIMGKLGVVSRVQAVAVALHNGLIGID
ncbi:MAG: LuxR C-terminal-related transcriptional regulator [Syntrophorhabdales bacterium]|jgi:DNA-binding CsgD family transcriptional regulator